jgi:hypothetical protein
MNPNRNLVNDVCSRMDPTETDGKTRTHPLADSNHRI